MKNFDLLIETLERLSVPKKRLDALNRIEKASMFENDFVDVGLSQISSTRLLTIMRSFLVSSTAMFLIKKYSGKKILVVWGSARGNVIYPGTVQYERVERVCAMAGSDWIIVHGGGDAIMDAARQGGKRGNSITVALHFDSEYSYQQGKKGVTDTVNLYHSEFYSRLFSFLEYADAVVIDEGGLGTLQEKSWVEGCVQCKFHEELPIFTLCKAFYANVKNHFQQLLDANLCSERDRELIRHIEPGEEDQVFLRIAEYYARRPELVEKRRQTLQSQDEVVALI